MIINLRYALLGEELELARDVHIEVEDGFITHVGGGFVGGKEAMDFRNGLALPLLVNSHIHVLDYAFIEYGVGLELGQVVSELGGLKYELLDTLTVDKVRESIERLFRKSLLSGTGTLIIYLELPDHAGLITDLSRRMNVRTVVLARPKSVDPAELELLEEAQGIGLDSPLRYTEDQLSLLRKAFGDRGMLISTHVSESAEDHSLGDFRMAIEHLEPDLLIHGVYLDRDEMRELAERGISLALCPRSNMWFGVGIPPIRELMEVGINLVLGTDNAGLVEPDMWRELETAYNIVRLQGGRDVSAVEILKMATTNPIKIRNLGSACDNVIGEGRAANFLVLDLRETNIDCSRDIYASIAKRGSRDSISFIISGNYVYRRS